MCRNKRHSGVGTTPAFISGRSGSASAETADCRNEEVARGQARVKAKEKVELQVVPSEAREHRLKLGEMTDAEVVQASLDGDSRAFGDLVRRYDQRLLNFVYRTIGDRERGQDLVQETFVRVYRHLHRFDQTKKFSTWIYTIASNLAKNELRNRSRNPLVLFQTLKKTLGRRPSSARVGGHAVQAGRSVPEAPHSRQSRRGREAASRASPHRVRAP